MALDSDIVPEDDADEKKAKSAPWSLLAKKLLKKDETMVNSTPTRFGKNS